MASDERLLLRAAATDPYEVPWGACDKASEARMPAILMDCPVVSSRAAGPGMQERRATPWAGTSLSPPVVSPALRACVVPALRACACPRAARARGVVRATRENPLSPIPGVTLQDPILRPLRGNRCGHSGSSLEPHPCGKRPHFAAFMEIAGPLVRASREVSSITMPRRPHVARCTDSLCALPMMPRESCRQPESISCLVRTVLGAADWSRRQPHHPETP